MAKKLTPEQEAAFAAELEADGSFTFFADDIAEDLGIPPMSERQWTDDEINRVWAAYEEPRRAEFIARLPAPDEPPDCAAALLK